jgi:hypothetical protein
MFTDLAPTKTQGWDVITDPAEDYDTSRMKAKYFKILPHKTFLWYYDYVVWIDGSVLLRQQDFAEYVETLMKKSDLAMFRHPVRKCLYDEYNFCCRIRKLEDYDNSVRLWLENIDMPVDWGMWAGTVIIRKMRQSAVENLMNDWWQYIQKVTFRDQITFPYVCYRHKYTPYTIDENLYNNSLIFYGAHLK